MDAYQYEALPTSEGGTEWTRLLELLPSGGEATAPLQGRLRAVRLRDCARIDAMSYVWGEPAEPQRLQILNDDGSSAGFLDIRHNLHLGLCVFRRTHEPYVLWVDAVCINQADRAEQSSQVALMGQICYRANTRVWLGEDPNQHAPRVFPVLDAFGDVVWHRPDEVRSLHDRALALEPAVWKGLRELYRNPWFRRAWVQQELGLARECYFYWGDRAMCGQHSILGFQSWLGACDPRLRDYFRIDQGPVGAVRHNWISYGRSVTFSWGGGSEEHNRFRMCNFFLFVLLESAICKATDPRDHVYAFLGHPSAHRTDAYRPGPLTDDPNFYHDLSANGPPTLVQPDYAKDKADVFTELARQLLLQHQDLRPLSAVMHTRETLASGPPSWVPCWDVIGSRKAIGCQMPEYHKMMWQASRPSFRFVEGSRPGLEVQGIVFGSIDEILSNEDGKIPVELREGRRMCRSHSPSLEDGIVPDVAEVGDLIAVLVSATAPCVLRKIQVDGYLFIGTCSVPPLMQPSGMNTLVRQPGLKLETFVLR